MPINFPKTPVTNQAFTSPNGKKWKWDGSKWTNSLPGAIFTPQQTILTQLIPVDSSTVKLHWNPLTGILSADLVPQTTDFPISPFTEINIRYDSSGSMTPESINSLVRMKDYFLKNELLKYYNNNESLYASKVTFASFNNERTFQTLTSLKGAATSSDVINIIFQDEAADHYHPLANFSPIVSRTSTYNTDMAAFRNLILSKPPGFYKTIIFCLRPINPIKVPGAQYPAGEVERAFGEFIHSIKYGIGQYSGSNGMDGIKYFEIETNVNDNAEPIFYTNLILNTIKRFI
jgi:hypothetical protein